MSKKKTARKKATKKRSTVKKTPLTNRANFTAKRKSVFLESYRITGNMSLSSQESRVSRRTIYDWLASDVHFQDDFNEAREVATDALEEEARRRAVDGVETPFNTKGETIFIRKFSDTLLIVLLKANRPSKFRENPQGSPINVSVGGGAEQPMDRRQGLDLSCLSDEELSALEVITKKVRKASAIGATPASSRSPR